MQHYYSIVNSTVKGKTTVRSVTGVCHRPRAKSKSVRTLQ